MRFNLEEYETVEVRLDKFWAEYPNGRVTTELVHHSSERFIILSTIYRDIEDANPFATGYAEEIVGATPVNKTSALENCETSSLGRALANGGFAAKGKRPSQQEMVKVASREALMSPGDAMQKINEAKSPEELKELWNLVPLETKVEGFTIREHILDRVQTMKSGE
jgi:hypothetical protein